MDAGQRELLAHGEAVALDGLLELAVPLLEVLGKERLASLRALGSGRRRGLESVTGGWRLGAGGATAGVCGEEQTGQGACLGLLLLVCIVTSRRDPETGRQPSLQLVD